MQIEPRQLDRAMTTLHATLDDDYHGKWFITDISPYHDGSVTVTATYLLPWEDDQSFLDFMTGNQWSHVKVTANVGEPTVSVIDDFPLTDSPHLHS